VSRQLLDSTSANGSEPRFTDLNLAIVNVLGMMRRMLGADVNVTTRLTEAPVVLQACPFELEWLLLNLAANARDAMGGRGSADVETAVVEIWSLELLGTVAWADRYVRLTFTDTGSRVPLELRERLFSPPSVAAGNEPPSGIGLARMSFTVRKLGGWIDADAEEGVGVRVHIHLPLANAARRN
jgi:C4-dicarboxylate-specific signal transduction histidine kinase